jgi:ethanolamine ammonia-lyase small subunit
LPESCLYRPVHLRKARITTNPSNGTRTREEAVAAIRAAAVVGAEVGAVVGDGAGTAGAMVTVADVPLFRRVAPLWCT